VVVITAQVINVDAVGEEMVESENASRRIFVHFNIARARVATVPEVCRIQLDE
jgi:hypothetical protein